MTEEKKALILKSFEKSPMLQLYQARLVDFSSTFFSISIPKQDYMVRTAGMFNGAVIASLVDASSGYAAVAAKQKDCYVVTVELKINYLRPAIGEELLSEAHIVKAGSKLAVVRTEIYAVSGDKKVHVATSLVTMMYLK